MMNKKILTMLFGLLLAVGWTSSASAQALPQAKVNATHKMMLYRENPRDTHGEATPMRFQMGNRFNAPKRNQDYTSTASKVYPKSWYESQAPVTWGSNSKLLTEPFTDPDGIIALLKRVYTDPLIPGIKHSDATGLDVPYQTIQYGWNITGTNYEDVIIDVSHFTNILIRQIIVTDPDGRERYNVTANANNAPTGWVSTYLNGRYYWYSSSSGGQEPIYIPSSYLQNNQGYSNITVYATNNRSGLSDPAVYIGNDVFGLYGIDVPYSYTYDLTECEYSLPGTLTAPIENGYTVMLVKLYDGFNSNYDDPDDRAPEHTYSESDLHNYFQKYVKEIQLLTDGCRVDEGGDNAGTMFSYSGDLNRFFFISKGKMAYYSSLENIDYDMAPFYSMYEEFSPTTSGTHQDEVTDFFERMRQEETYSVLHDCQSVIWFQHYFSMSGKQGTTENPISNLVFYIPDKRGGNTTNWRNYLTGHQPTVGMYIIHLNAAVQAIPSDPDHYNVNVTWTSNLSHIAGDTEVPQIYYLFATYENGTTVLLTPNGTHDLSYLHNVDTGDPNGYPISYYVIGMPFVDNNDDGINDYTGTNVFDDIDTDFQAKSNTETVNIPGKNDFVNLERVRYESDYDVVDELNYYRNFFTVKNIPTTGTNGVTKDYVGTDGKSLVLLRGGDKVIYLDLKMEGDKCYYRFRHVDRTIEDGYNEDGNKNSNN